MLTFIRRPRFMSEHKWIISLLHIYLESLDFVFLVNVCLRIGQLPAATASSCALLFRSRKRHFIQGNALSRRRKIETRMLTKYLTVYRLERSLLEEFKCDLIRYGRSVDHESEEIKEAEASDRWKAWRSWDQIGQKSSTGRSTRNPACKSVGQSLQFSQ